MRTTVDLEERTLERAKKLAASTGRTLSEVVGAALAAYSAGRGAARGGEPFELVVRGRSGARFPSAAEIAEVLEEEDVAGLARRRRAPS